MSRRVAVLGFAAMLLCAVSASAATREQKFPMPEFESGYELPVEQIAAPKAQWHRWLDVALLVVGMVLVAWPLHSRGSLLPVRVSGWLLWGGKSRFLEAFAPHDRRRLLIKAVGICALAYFGFVRYGCICPVGATCNVSRGLLTAGPPVPWTVIALFTAPLVAALAVGRVFCGSVCPLGAIQDIVLLRPVRVPRWLDEPLGLFRWFYLAAAVALVYASGRFLICQHDPFVGFFRMNATLPMLAVGVGLLVVSMFVGRVYCRYICPYGALLGLAGRFSVRRVKVTPAECIKCGLCADACPFGAIRMYQEPAPAEPPKPRVASALGLLGLTAALTVGGGLLGWQVGKPWARTNHYVDLAAQVWIEQRDGLPPQTLASQDFAEKGTAPEALYELAEWITDRFVTAATWGGGFCGLVIGLKLLSLSRRRPPEVVEVDAAKCLSCGRCYRTCPVHRRQDGKGGDSSRE